MADKYEFTGWGEFVQLILKFVEERRQMQAGSTGTTTPGTSMYGDALPDWVTAADSSRPEEEDPDAPDPGSSRWWEELAAASRREAYRRALDEMAESGATLSDRLSPQMLGQLAPGGPAGVLTRSFGLWFPLPGRAPEAADVDAWRTSAPLSYWEAHDSALSAFEAYDIDSGDFKRGFDAWAEDFFQQNREWPDLTDVYPEMEDGFPVADGLLASYVLRSAIRTDALPRSFWVVDDETGEEHYVVNTVDRGPMPVEGSEWDFWADIGPPQALAAQLSVRGHEVMANQISSGRFITAPRIPQSLLPKILNMDVLTPTSGGGGRGVVFDRDKVIESIRENWRSLLLEEPANIGGMADSYINQATSFAYQGGSLDLNTWVLNKARESSRYRVLYARKPEGVNEIDYISSYLNVASQAGLRADSVTSHAARGAQYNLNPAAFGESLEATREFRAQNIGGFSRRFAQTLAGLGPMMRG